MAKVTRVPCRECGAQLATILNDRLVVAGHEVQYTPRQPLTIICTGCRTPRVWTDRKAS